jgi:hypothetical protein
VEMWDIAQDHNSGHNCNLASSPHNCSQHTVAERREWEEAM